MRRLWPLLIPAPLMAACASAPQPSQYTLYDVRPAVSWPYSGGIYYPRSAQPPILAPPVEPGPDAPLAAPSWPNTEIPPGAHDPPPAPVGGSDYHPAAPTTIRPNPVPAPHTPDTQIGGASSLQPPMIDSEPPGSRCGWWRLCNLWD